MSVLSTPGRAIWFSVLTDLENVVAVSIKRSLSQFNNEHTVGATGLSVQAGVSNLPLFLTWNNIVKANVFKYLDSQISSSHVNLSYSGLDTKL